LAVWWFGLSRFSSFPASGLEIEAAALGRAEAEAAADVAAAEDAAADDAAAEDAAAEDAAADDAAALEAAGALDAAVEGRAVVAVGAVEPQALRTVNPSPRLENFRKPRRENRKRD
jgi:hypothetical protein